MPKPSPRTGRPTKVSNVLQQVGWTEDTQPEGLSGRANPWSLWRHFFDPSGNIWPSGPLAGAQRDRPAARRVHKTWRSHGAMRFQMFQQSGHQTVPWKIPHLVVGKSSIYMDIRRDYRRTTRPKRLLNLYLGNTIRLVISVLGVSNMNRNPLGAISRTIGNPLDIDRLPHFWTKLCL